VDLTKGYIGTSNGIYVFHTGYDEKTGKYDENQMSIEASAIEGTTGISSSDLYHSQIRILIYVITENLISREPTTGALSFPIDLILFRTGTAVLIRWMIICIVSFIMNS